MVMTDGQAAGSHQPPAWHEPGLAGTGEASSSLDLHSHPGPDVDQPKWDAVIKIATEVLEEPQWNTLKHEVLRLGQAVLARWVACPAGPASCTLTTEETAILHLVDEGLTNNQIAEKLSLDGKAVRNTLSRMGRKLGIGGSNRIKIVAAARRADLIR